VWGWFMVKRWGMAGDNEIFLKVREAVNIVDVIGEHLALKRAGREFKALCPFHDDHRPSMAVVPHKQIFHCFVCGMGGDVFKFVKEYHKMSTAEALRYLAQKANITLPELPRGQGYGARAQEAKSAREQIADTNEKACKFFENTLYGEGGRTGLEYFLSRGLTDETIKKFRLGFSLDSWTGLCNAAFKLGISTEQLEGAGLIKKRSDGSPYDAFRNRVIFPIVDASNRVIAFGGRVLAEKRDEAGNVVEAKYLNSPETRLFNKSESLYGINHARQAIIRSRTAVIVEGYMDVIACHQAGVSNVIATLGTALTPDHAKTLKNYAQTIVLVFDSDDAGYRAADRAMEVFVRTSLDIKIASVPDGKDPCDFCIKLGDEGGTAFQALVDGATDAITYQWKRVQKQFGTNDSLAARQEAITQFMRFAGMALEPMAGREIDPLRRGLVIGRIATLVSLPVEQVNEMVQRQARMATPAVRAPVVVPEEEAAAPAKPRVDVRTLKGLGVAEGWVLGCLLTEPPIYLNVRDELSVTLFAEETLRPLANVVFEYLEGAADLHACNIADFCSHCEDETLVSQAIELEAATSDWLSPGNLSPEHAKLVTQLKNDLGRTCESKLRGALAELKAQRGGQDMSAEDFPDEDAPPKPVDDWLSAAKKRNAGGGNKRSFGLH